ncbi:MAG: hypothetical protein HOG15_04555, partial [Anaerolineae bacterium]|nr:hypothetical protein [Anaerolineae bacterium]
RVDKVAVLSGFVPPGVDEILHPKLLNKIRVFWAHGTQDELIPIERGLSSVELLQKSGADVNLCQAKVGHKVGKDCRRALDAFLDEKF